MKTGSTCLLLLLLFLPALLPAQSRKSFLPNLNGKWVLKTDPGYTLQFKNNIIYEAHRNQRGVDTFTYIITSHSCLPAKWNDKKGFYLVKTAVHGSGACYRLLTYSSNAFSMMAAGNGTVYRFIRYFKRY